MGLFLFGKGKSKPKGKAKPKRQWSKTNAATGFDATRTYRLVRIATTLVVLAGLGIGVYFGQTYLKQRIAEQQATAVDVHLVDAPAWLGESRIAELESEVAAVVRADPLDRRSLDKAAAMLASNAWVERVRRIDRGYRGRVDVHLIYREPVALVGARDGFHLVDAEARRLPGVYPYQQVKALGLPAITGVSAAPPAEGDPWPGADVRAGLKLAMLLAGTPWAAQVRAVDVANHAGRADRSYPHLSIITADGTVRWGRTPGEESIYEPPVDEKLAMLERIADSYRGSIDAGGRVVDVFLDTPMIHSESAVRYTAMP